MKSWAQILGMVALAWISGALADAVTPLSPAMLLGKPAVRAVSLSPDGSRLAAVADVGQRQNALILMKVEDTKLTPLWKTSVTGLIDVTRYHWVSSDVILLWIDVGGGNGSVWAMVDIPNAKMIQLSHQFAQLVHDHWGDADHVLIYDICETQEMCFYDWNLRKDSGVPYAKSLSMSLQPRPRVDAKGQLTVITGTEGDAHRLTWNAIKHDWTTEPVDATVAKAASAQQNDLDDADTTAGPNADLTAAARTRFDALRQHVEVMPVTTAGNHAVVGAQAPPPGPAFMSLVPPLDAAAQSIAAAFPGKRVYWQGVSDDFKHVLLQVQGIGEPPSYYLWAAGNDHLVFFDKAFPDLDTSKLGKVSINTSWYSDGAAVQITTPPTGVATSGVILEPIVADAAQARMHADEFAPQSQALAQHGVVSIRVPIPPIEPKGTLRGAAWRKAVADRIQTAADQAAAAGLASGKPCIEGRYEAAYAALAAAAAAPDKYACVIAVNLPFQSADLAKPLNIPGTTNRTGFIWNLANDVPAWTAMTAADGADSGEPLKWVDHLPARVLLAYPTTSDSFGPAISWRSTPFVTAMKRAGKTAQVYDSGSNYDDDAKWYAAMDDTVMAFMR